MRFHSRIATNSFATKEVSMMYPYRNMGDSFGGLSKPQYSHLIYYQLANNGAGAGTQGERWQRAYGSPTTSFIPPPSRV